MNEYSKNTDLNLKPVVDIIKEPMFEKVNNNMLVNNFLLEVDNSTNKVLTFTKLFSLDGKSLHDVIASTRRYHDDTRIVHYSKKIDGNKYNSFKYINGEVVSDDDSVAKLEQLESDKEAIKYLTETDKFIAKATETGTDVPAEVLQLRAHYRAQLDGHGEFSKLMAQTIEKLATI